jgi:ATP-dependent Clp protease ATP-binding subunit ClpC
MGDGYNFTEGIRRVLLTARQEAARLHHEYVGTEHMLLAICRETEGVAHKLMSALHLDAKKIATEIEGDVKRGRASASQPADDLTFTSRAKKALELALAGARELGDESVGVEHLLLGLMREQKGIAAAVLEEFGANDELIVSAILQLRANAEPRSRQPDSQPSSGRRRSEAKRYPALDELSACLPHGIVSPATITIIADLDSVPAEIVATLMAGLDGLHRAWGGAGLSIERESVGASSESRVVA